MFFNSKNVRMLRYDIVQSYMVVGGIPYYLGYFESGLSLPQNIDKLFFVKDAKLQEEYDRLFASVFSKPEEMKRIVKFLSTRRSGYTQEQIARKTGISQGGTLSNMLKALIASEFVMKYVPFGFSKREEHYKLMDPFCIFYLCYVHENVGYTTSFWQENQTSQSIVSWRGFAFEEVCLLHTDQIKQALGILGVSSRQSSWALRGDDDKDGAQIDLLIERADHVINMCEMKFYGEEFTVNKSYYQKLSQRQKILSEQLKKRQVIHSTLVTTYGLKYNEYSGAFQRVIKMDALFQ